MTRNVLFVQGGGEGAHACDAKLVASLEEHLGGGFAVHYPLMPNESDPGYVAWRDCIGRELRSLGDDAVLVGHSVGAAILIKLLAEEPLEHPIAGIFLIAAPFMHASDGWQWKEAELPANAADALPKDVPLFVYHGRDDETVPFSHLALYSQTFRRATARALEGRNHQLNDDLTEVANDIRAVRA